ncbi:AAA family ATPase [Prevotella sp. tf2-5]|uniref:AAA family ATPase n=1 Tax=Prevotella sp. tf2-5 TaxID=1761889 RepID=UPI0008E634E6|nr:AAA family ATPase [Prevotella sp. tf2-5]SFO90548.1 type VII secretion AAA-ATPase EccA [Prevotella sp. tf2-5]
MASFFDRFNSKQLTIVIVCITACFLMMGACTMVLGNEGEESKEKKLVIDDDDDGSDVGGRKYKFTDKEDRSEGGEEGDSVNVKKPIEGDPYKELDELIGLDAVKAEVRSLANYVKVQKQRQEKGLKTPNLSYHLVFTGSPGTGKTTVARIVARIYKDLGILKKGHLVETDRSGLIGQYVGQTAPRVNQMCDSALNGVLFIDEAYAITQSDAGADYGKEAVATLLKRMEDDRDRLVVIVAGYTNEMKKFIDTNPGLQSRFNRYIHFPDYSSDDLYKIFRQYLKKNQYTITKEAASYLKEQLDYAVEHKDRNFGNARFVRNTFEKTIQAQANRIAKAGKVPDEELVEITLADIKSAI